VHITVSRFKEDHRGEIKKKYVRTMESVWKK
jgi:hypothetical protein